MLLLVALKVGQGYLQWYNWHFNRHQMGYGATITVTNGGMLNLPCFIGIATWYRHKATADKEGGVPDLALFKPSGLNINGSQWI